MLLSNLYIRIITFLCLYITNVVSVDYFVNVNAAGSTQDGTIENPCLDIKCATQLSYDQGGSFNNINILAGIYSGTNNENICRINCSIGLSFLGSDNSDVIIMSTSINSRAFYSRNNDIASIQDITISNFTYEPTFTNELDIFTGIYGGSALYVHNSTISLLNVVCNGNSAHTGGAASFSGNSDVTIFGSIFASNSASSQGGAIECLDSALHIDESIFAYNSADKIGESKFGEGRGGGIFIGSDKGHLQNVITNSQFIANIAGMSGGSIHVIIDTIAPIMVLFISTNNTFSLNKVTGTGQCSIIGGACETQGGALFLNLPDASINDCYFNNNKAFAGQNEYAYGGAIFLTTSTTDAVTEFKQIYSNFSLTSSHFNGNQASSLGGAVYSIKKQFSLLNCTFVENYVGNNTLNSLFQDSSNSGGAFYFSGGLILSTIVDCTFEKNHVWGGWGGAIFMTNPTSYPVNHVNIINTKFINNAAYSSYTFNGQGGGVMASHNTNLMIDLCIFKNNTARPVDSNDLPLTLSGSGGAIFGQSAEINIILSDFEFNYAITGQFDSGSSGGAIALEHATSYFQLCHFINNGAAGYIGYSSFSGSGTGGALLLRYSSLSMQNCFFKFNWVTTGGTQLSTGAAIAIFSAFQTSTKEIIISIKNTIFEENSALGELCIDAGPRYGQGGAIAIVESKGIFLQNNLFLKNSAVAPYRTILNSYGGAILVTLSSEIIVSNCTFSSNIAVNGLGDDLAILPGDGGSDDSIVNYTASTFQASGYGGRNEAFANFTKLQQELCALISNIELNDNIYRRLYDSSGLISDRRLLISNEDRIVSFKSQLSNIHTLFNDLINFEKVDPYKVDNLIQLVKNDLINEIIKLETVVVDNKRLLKLTPDDLNIFDFDSIVMEGQSIVVGAGQASFENPIFIKNYNIFVGNILDLIDRGDTNAYGTGSNPCEVLISNSGNVIETDLKLTIYKATLKIQREIPSSTIYLKELHILNGTVYISNNITVTGNSTLAKSTIKSNVHSTFPKLTFLPHPFINFFGDVYTASFFQTKVDLLPTTSSLYELLLFPIMVFDAITVKIYGKFRLTSSILHGETQPKELQVLFTSGAILEIQRNATVEISTRTLLIGDSELTTVYNEGNIVLGGYSVIENSDSIDESEREAETIQAKINSATSSLKVVGLLTQTHHGKVSVTIGNMGNESYSLIEMSNNQTFLGEIHVDFIEGTTLTTPYYFSEYNDYPTNWSLIKYTSNVCPPLYTCDDKESAKIVGYEGIKFGTNFAYNSSNSEFPFHETLLVTNIQCNKLAEYYNTQGDGPTSQLCYLCSQNSSCNYCAEKNTCVDNNQYDQNECQSKDSDHATTGINSCCNPTCNNGGTCSGKPYTLNEQGQSDDFQCTCSSFFWKGGSSNCSDPTMVGFAVLIISCSLVLIPMISSFWNFYYKDQKELFVEELRQNLLHHSIDGTFANYVPSLQRDLILNDVFVKYEEISKEKVKVGEGSFGVVYKASFRGANVAVKQMRSPLFMEITHNEEEEFRKEAYMMSRLRHPNLVLVMGISYVDIEPVKKHPDMEDDMKVTTKKLDSAGNIKKSKSVCIITEYLEQGSLSDILYGPTRLPAEIWTYELILTCALQAARGMLYLHSHSPPICHRDLKSSNLVVDDHWVVKVTDFGMSRIVPDKILDIDKGLVPRKTKDGDVQDALDFFGISDTSSSPSAEDKRILKESMNQLQHSNISLINKSIDNSFEGSGKGNNRTSNLEMTSNLGTTAWCAPELLTASSTTKYSVKVDVYSFGMVLWELWEKKRPFEELHSRFDIMDAIRANKRPTISNNCPVAYKDLIQVCWDKDPEKRPTFKRILHDMKEMLASEKRKLKVPNSKSGNMPHGLLSQTSITGRFTFSQGDNNKITRSSLSSLNVNMHQTPLLATSPGGSISSMLAWGNRKSNSNKSNSNNDRNESDDAIQMNTEIVKGTGVEVINISNNNPNNPTTQIPIVRAPLLAFERSLSHLAESPAFSPSMLTGNSPFITSQHYPQSPVKDPRLDGNIQTNTGGGGGISNNKLQPKVWRDRYVMKFNGWKSSEPDNNLPPSLLTGQPILSPSSTGNSIGDNTPPIRPLVDRDSISTMNVLHINTNTTTNNNNISSSATIPIQPKIETNTTTTTSSNLSVDDNDGMFDMDDRKN